MQMRLYKPNKAGNGAASQWQISTKIKEKGGKKFKQTMGFLTISQQTGKDTSDNASFGWTDKNKTITMKLGQLDAANIISVLSGKSPKKDLFHKTQLGNSVLNISSSDKFPGFLLQASSQKGNQLLKVFHSISPEEAILLHIFLAELIKQTFN